ncbi:unnamed protein product, partial [Laminaria digitata]
RRVVVYKLGYEPPEEEVQLDAQRNMGSGRMAAASTASVAPMPAILPGGRNNFGGGGGDGGSGGGGAGGGGGGGVGGAGGGGRGGEGPGAGDLVRIGTVVKDRRTVQDLEEENRRKRQRMC